MDNISENIRLDGLPVAVTHSKGKRGGPQEGSDIHYEASHYANESKKKLKGVISGNEASRSSNQTPKVSMYSKEYGSLSEVACCSYEARQAGVRNGLFLGEALRRCPNLQTIPYDFEGYSEVSRQLYDIVASYTLDIEAVSCDELYIDCTELLRDVHLSPHQFASVLRAEIERETGCTASAGMGSNMLLARLATKVAKPNGQHYVHDAAVEKLMKQQKVGDLPGVGYTTAEKLHSLNIRTCEDLQSWSLSKLQQKFGTKTGQAFYNNCRGKDDRIVQYHKDRKSVSAEVNYGIRFETEEDIYNFINQLSNEVQNRIQNLNCKGKLVTLKLMVRKRDAPVETAKFMGHGVCDNLSHSISLKSATDSSQVISKECCAIARSLKIKPQDYRGVGIQISKLEPAQKDHKTIGSIFKPTQSNKESTTEMDSSYGVFAPKNLEKVKKVIPEKSTITHFLSNKSSPSKHLDNIVENDPVKNTSPLKQSEPSSKHGQKTKTIEHFLSNKPSTSRTKSYNFADYLPEEIDQSVLEALPEDLKKEILESCKSKSAESEGNSLNQSASTSSASKQNESIKSLCQKQKSEEIGVRVDSNSLQPEPIGLDQSFLNALPEDLRKEVLDSYDSISNKKNKNSTLTSTAQQPSTLFASKSNNQLKITPKKNSDNHTSGPNSNLRTNSTIKLDESVLNALPEDLKKEVLESYGGHPSSKTHKLPQPSTSNQVCSLKGYVSTEQKSSKATSEIDSDEKPVKKIPTLAGAIELDDVRALIKEWIDSTEDPLEEDINDVKTFLLSFVMLACVW
ncbi:DNA repair protein REV1 [Araneus ventricosus]|uniref:DNA repair protein REV1 n=1 Tax=Araneus ventricosus TaxID=182803 RepID=A0A4Y2AN87_ARAVE|nr:DNA repair protein REV1 [Araneus ventricosus]